MWVLMCLFKGIERQAIYHIWHEHEGCFKKYKKYGESKKNKTILYVFDNTVLKDY